MKRKWICECCGYEEKWTRDTLLRISCLLCGNLTDRRPEKRRIKNMYEKQRVQILNMMDNSVKSEHKTWALAEKETKRLDCNVDRFALRLKYDDFDCPKE